MSTGGTVGSDPAMFVRVAEAQRQAQRIMATAQRQRRPVLAPAADADAVDGRAAQWRPHVGEGEANPLSPAGRRDSIDSTDTVEGGVSRCPICLLPPGELGEERDTVTTPCRHQFCAECLAAAVEANRRAGALLALPPPAPARPRFYGSLRLPALPGAAAGRVAGEVAALGRAPRGRDAGRQRHPAKAAAAGPSVAAGG